MDAEIAVGSLSTLFQNPLIAPLNDCRFQRLIRYRHDLYDDEDMLLATWIIKRSPHLQDVRMADYREQGVYRGIGIAGMNDRINKQVFTVV